MRQEPTKTVTCIDCSTEFTHVGRGRCLRCSECRKRNATIRSRAHAIAHGKIKNPGVGSGGAQYLENNSQWKDGRVAYRRLARMASSVCYLCGHEDDPSRMCAHHKDHNRTNNDPSNLVLVCKACHQNVEHKSPRDDKGKYCRSKIAELSENPQEGQLEPKAG